MIRPLVLILTLGWTVRLFWAAALAYGAPADQPSEADERPEPLSFFRNKPPLSDMIVEDKREGTLITGIPVLGYNPDTEYAYGGIAQIYHNDYKDSPFFRYAPYRRLIEAGIKGATGGVRSGFINYDHPYIGDSPWRVRSKILLSENDFENYFGTGEETMELLSFPGAAGAFKRFEDYEEALNLNRDGRTWRRFDDYKKTEKSGLILVEYDLAGGLFRPQIGLQISDIDVEDYTGENFQGAVIQETRLRRDLGRGRIRGFDGGWDNAFRAGLTFDTRDFEPDPVSGLQLQTAGRFASEWLGAGFDYQQITLAARGFYNLSAEPRRLVLAGRLAYAMQFGDVPFFSASLIPLTDGDKTGLGGFETLRGYSESRFAGEAAMFANLEARWSFAETTFIRQHLRFMLAPFLDTGRVFDSIGRTRLDEWKAGGGIGLRLAWNVSTVVSFDLAYSPEDTFDFYMELGHQF